MLRVRGAVAVLAVTGLVAAGCSSGAPQDGGSPAQPASPPAAPVEPPDPGTPAPEQPDAAVAETLAFTAPTVNGGEFDAATLAGQPVVFWFWASWCPRCAAAASTVRAVQADYAGRVHVVGVAGLSSGESGMRDFVERHQLGGFPHLADDDGQVWRQFGVASQEYYVLLDSAGQIVHQGPLSEQQLRDRLDTLAG